MMIKRAFKRLLAAVLVAALPGAVLAQEVVAVLSSDQSAYSETYKSFLAAFGKAAPVLALGEPIPAETKIVLAFGGKAAFARYPGRVTLIYGIAPGILVEKKTHDGPSVKIMMMSDAGVLISRLKVIQPGLKQLAMLWSCPNVAGSAEHVIKAGETRGVTVTAERLEDPDDLPARLRWLKGRVDAIWLPPDPILINAHNFEIIKHFSYDNDIPFYAPTEGLAEQGATGAVSVSYTEMGRAMADAAKAVLAGDHPASQIFVARTRLSVNRTAAAESELSVSPEALKAADKVFP